MYRNELKEELIKILNSFYREEQGNRVTTNIVDGLTLKLIKSLDANKVEEKAENPKGEKEK